MNFLNHFGKTQSGNIIVFDIFTFNNLFILLLNSDFSHEDALTFILANCELNTYIFQECIYNASYLNLKQKLILPEEAGRKSALHQIALSYLNL